MASSKLRKGLESLQIVLIDSLEAHLIHIKQLTGHRYNRLVSLDLHLVIMN